MSWPEAWSAGPIASACLLALLGAAGLVVAGCDDRPAPTLRFEVDAPGVTYVYRHPPAGLRSAASLERVPLAQRGATIVYTGEAMGADTEMTGMYVADLVEARPGQEAVATLVSRETFGARSFAAERAHWLAELVRIEALETTGLDFRSDRQRSSRESLRRLQALEPRIVDLPKTDAMPDAGRDAASPPPPGDTTDEAVPRPR